MSLTRRIVNPFITARPITCTFLHALFSFHLSSCPAFFSCPIWSVAQLISCYLPSTFPCSCSVLIFRIVLPISDLFPSRRVCNGAHLMMLLPIDCVDSALAQAQILSFLRLTYPILCRIFIGAVVRFLFLFRHAYKSISPSLPLSYIRSCAISSIEISDKII